MANQWIERRQMTPEEIEERRLFIMDQRVHAHSFDAICGMIETKFGYRISVAQCAADFRELMKKRSAEVYEDLDAMRATMLAQIDLMLTKTLDKAEGGDLDAVDLVIKLLQRKTRLLGTDMPVKVEKSDTSVRLSREQMLERIEAIKSRLLGPRKDDPANNAVDAVIEEVPRKDNVVNIAGNPIPEVTPTE